jgi:hypothetical protein
MRAAFLLAFSSLMSGPHSRTLERALQIVVTKERLAAALDIEIDDLDKYLAGTEPLPHEAFLAALDIVASGRR